MSNIEKTYEELKVKYKEQLEKLLNEVKNERIMYGFGYAIYALITLITFFAILKTNSNILLAFFALEILILPYIPIFIYKRWSKNENYKKEYAKLVFKDILDNFKEIKEYNHIKGIEYDKYKEANFDNHDDIYKSKCYVKGIIDEKYQFEISNVYTKNFRLFRMEYTYIFDGTFIVLNIPKKFEEKIFITKQNQFGMGKPEILNDVYKVYCKNKSNNKNKLNIELFKDLLKTQLFDEIVIKDQKIYLRSFDNIFETPNIKEEPINLERISKYYNNSEDILDNLKRITREI